MFWVNWAKKSKVNVCGSCTTFHNFTFKEIEVLSQNVCGQVFHGIKWKLNLTRVADHQWQWPLYFGRGPIWSRSCCLWKWWSTVLPWIRFRLPWPSCITTRIRGNCVDCGSNATSKPLNKWRPNCASLARVVFNYSVSSAVYPKPRRNGYSKRFRAS
jgi:hypothetical protein